MSSDAENINCCLKKKGWAFLVILWLIAWDWTTFSWLY